MLQKIGLIQLVSEEAMPSLLPLLALKPTAVTHIVSSSFEHQSAHIMRAAESVDVAPLRDAYIKIPLSDMPSMAETNRAVSDAIAAFKRNELRPVLNFTGGTKLMSVGAFKAASDAEITSLYVDGDRGFCDGDTGPPLSTILPDGLNFDKIREHLSVKLIATANGCEKGNESRNFNDLLPLSRYLLTNPQDERAVWKALHGPNGALRFMDATAMSNKWERVLATEFRFPPVVERMAKEVGLIESRGKMIGFRCHKHKTLSMPIADGLKDLEEAAFGASPGKEFFGGEWSNTVRDLQWRVNFFGGGWWEVAIAGLVSESKAFRDVCWGVEIAKKGQQSLEEDVLAVEGIQLAYFSCKRGSQKIMRQLEEVDASARRIGGRLAKKYFCVYNFNGRSCEDARKRAAQLHMKIITPLELKDFHSFLMRTRQ